ncbi:hypothetical protein KR222_007747 [Zaprionus bogoriensis]|nr:hypothetical protein KR222_007747 [Zaprionus bogoriensis]
MYIYPSSPESASSLQSEESAAIKIQAGFRGYRVRKQLYRLTKSGGSHSSSGGSSSKVPRSSRVGAGRRQQQRTMEERLLNTANARAAEGAQQATDHSSVEDRCATKIQAGFRGFLVRKKQKIATDAAVKIQSSFRGFKARKEAEKLKHT